MFSYAILTLLSMVGAAAIVCVQMSLAFYVMAIYSAKDRLQAFSLLGIDGLPTGRRPEREEKLRQVLGQKGYRYRQSSMNWSGMLLGASFYGVVLLLLLRIA